MMLDEPGHTHKVMGRTIFDVSAKRDTRQNWDVEPEEIRFNGVQRFIATPSPAQDVTGEWRRQTS